MKDNSHKNRTEILALVPFQCSTSICLSRPSGDRGGGTVLRTRAPPTPSFACLSSLRWVALFPPQVLIVCTALCARVFLRAAHLLVCSIVCRMLLLLYVRRRQQPRQLCQPYPLSLHTHRPRRSWSLPPAVSPPALCNNVVVRHQLNSSRKIGGCLVCGAKLDSCICAG